MSISSNIIHINGKRYDADSGQPLDHGLSEVLVEPAAKQTAKPAVQLAAKQPVPTKSARKAAKNARRHQPQTASTLMRASVRKPIHEPNGLRAQGSLKLAKPAAAAVTAKASVNRVDHQRLRHASKVPQSKLVSRFSPVPLTAYVPPSGPATEPIPRIAKTIDRPSQRQLSVFEAALLRADSHRQPPPKQVKNHRTARIVSVSGAALLLIVLAGLVSWQNVGNLRLRLASAQAGFTAHLPGQRPAGFSLGAVTAAPGKVAINFGSNSDQVRHYSITESASGWDNAALRDQYVTPADANYQTASSGSKTIFLYGNGNATWVSNGIWYVISSDGSLGNQQLVDLAGSL